MKRIGNLFPRVVEFHHLCSSAKQASRGKKDKEATQRFFLNLEPEILGLQEDLLAGQYEPLPYHVFTVTDPKSRQICAPAFRDQVLHHALCSVLEPVFEKSMLFDSYACRKGKGSQRALQRAQNYSRKYRFYLKLDVKKFFHSVDHGVMLGLIARKIKDPQIQELVRVVLHHSPPDQPTGKGLPIGNLTSQHFANWYLNPLDHLIKESLHVPGYLRYMDDLLLFADSRPFLWDCYDKIQAFLGDTLKLELRDNATRLAPVSEGLPYLGYRVFPGLIRLRRENLRRSLRGIRKKQQEFENGRISEGSYVDSLRSVIGFWEQAQSRPLRRDLFLSQKGV